MKDYVLNNRHKHLIRMVCMSSGGWPCIKNNLRVYARPICQIETVITAQDNADYPENNIDRKVAKGHFFFNLFYLRIHGVTHYQSSRSVVSSPAFQLAIDHTARSSVTLTHRSWIRYSQNKSFRSLGVNKMSEARNGWFICVCVCVF